MIIAGTGHRPPTLGINYSFEASIPYRKAIKNKLLELGAKVVISGMASGFDLWLADEANQLGIPLIAYALEFQTDTWPTSAQNEYNSIINQASAIEMHPKGQYFVRDEAMVDNCDEVLALWNPSVKRGGTFHTVKYADMKDKVIHNIYNMI